MSEPSMSGTIALLQVLAGARFLANLTEDHPSFRSLKRFAKSLKFVTELKEPPD
jgi:hypothetical protein